MKKSVLSLLGIIQKQANIKEIETASRSKLIKSTMKPEYSKLGPSFAQKTPKVIAALSKEKPHVVLSHIEKEGEFRINVDGEELSIKPEHIVIERSAEEPYLLAYEQNLSVLMNPTLDDELLSEGYIRELTRRIQELRKKSGMKKSDRIKLLVSSEEKAVAMLNTKELVEKLRHATGSSEAELSTKQHGHFDFTANEKIRDYEFFIGISRE